MVLLNSMTFQEEWSPCVLVHQKTKHDLISYFLTNTSAKPYRNRIVCVTIIASERRDVFLRHSVVFNRDMSRDR